MAYLLIDIPTSDLHLASKADWLALDDTIKTHHIEQASYFTRANWDCSPIDWDNTQPGDLPTEIEQSIAYYSYMDFNGTLYDSDAGTKEVNIKKTSDAAGSVNTSTEYFKASTESDRFNSIDAVMNYNCSKPTSTSSGTKEVQRV